MEPASGSSTPGGVGSGVGSSSGGGSSSRWNPTKEQLSMLEGLYGQGIRTPSAEQIQSITKRLQIYGHIEGKNVFYWFQNHKARQRQKQKMDQINSANIINNNNSNVVVNHINNNVNAAYFNRFYYHPSPPVSPSVASAAGGSHPLFQASPHNVAYSPYYIAQPDFAFYPHSCPKMVLPNHILNNTQTPSHRHDVHHDIAAFAVQNSGNNVGVNNGAYPSNGQVTLDLFPVHPTGILQHREHRSSSIGSSTENSLETRSDQDVTPAIQSFSSPSGVKFDVFSKRDVC